MMVLRWGCLSNLAVGWAGFGRLPKWPRDCRRTCAASDMLKLLEHVARRAQLIATEVLTPPHRATCSSCAPHEQGPSRAGVRTTPDGPNNNVRTAKYDSDTLLRLRTGADRG